MRPVATGLVEQSSVREPLVDTIVDDKDNNLIITAEIPGVAKQDKIKLKAPPKPKETEVQVE